MSAVVSGGKVWNIPSDTPHVSPAPPENQWGKFMLRFLPLALLFPVATVVFGFKFIDTKPTGYQSIEGGYIKDYDLNPSIWPFVAIAVLALLTYISFKLSDRFMGTTFLGIAAGPLVAMALIFASFIFNGVSDPEKNKNVYDWAKSSYGYTSIDSFAKDDNFTMATKADGSKTQVSIYRYQNNIYLSETLTQQDELIAKLKALETAK